MSKVTDWLGYILALTKALVANTTQNRTSFWIFACMMFANNVVYFTMWAIYF